MNNWNKHDYIKEVLNNIGANRKIKKRIKEDLNSRIDEAIDIDAFYDIGKEMGEPLTVAAEFMENLDVDSSKTIVQVGLSDVKYEYKSETTVFGIPLVHINTGGINLNRVAKGIIAIGDVSYGVIAIGGVAFGGIAIGGIAYGVSKVFGGVIHLIF